MLINEIKLRVSNIGTVSNTPTCTLITNWKYLVNVQKHVDVEVTVSNSKRPAYEKAVVERYNGVQN